MKTRFSRRPRFITPARSIALAALGACLLLIALVRVVAPGALIAAATPLFAFGNAAASLAALPAAARDQEAEIRRLRSENARLSEENAGFAARLADLNAADGSASIIAGVLAGPPQSPYDALIIGAGEEDGVIAGMRALSGGVPVGTVASVSRASARVALYSAPGTETLGWAGDARIPVMLRGEGGGAFAADVPKDAGLIPGDLVYLPGPGARPVGTVAKVETDPSSPRAVLRIRPAANPFSMTEVELAAAPL